jgi:mono/diheme cytochrome c family protein
MTLLTRLLVSCTAVFPLVGTGAETDEVFFERKIRPVLLEHCVSCHGPEKQKGHLRLDTPEGIRAGGETGAIFEAGDPEKSRMIRAVRYLDEDLKMPPKKRLSDAQVEDLARWVKGGAAMPAGDPSATNPAPRKEFQIAERDRQHWAFQPLRRPTMPPSDGKPLHPIDALIGASLKSRGLTANPAASRRELIRRATFDLTGLPPTPEEVQAFEYDPAPNAWETLIDRLLASPHYGEKWGRHWLDLVRFAESNSYERDGAKPHAWRYRDYVIRSLNADKPYDRFLKEQLAGDEFPEPDADAIIATGFYRLGIWDDEPADRELARYDALDDIVTTTGQTFLGLTVDCARCHHHKIDPISQNDYYRLVSFFQNVNHYRNGGPTDEVPVFSTAADRSAHEQKQRELDSRRNELQREVTDLETRFQARHRESQSARRPDLDGLRYRYYRDTWEKLPDFTLIKPEDTGALTNNLVDLSPRTRDTAIGFVFEATLIVPQTGDYTFFLDSDDGARLSIDGRSVLVYDGIHTQGMEKKVTLNLQQGRVPFQLDYFQKADGLGLSLTWSGAGFARRPLSSDASKGGIKPPSAAELATLIKANGEIVLGKEDWSRYQEVKAELEQLKQTKLPVDLALAVTEAGATPPETFVLLRGNPNLKGDKVEPGFLQVLGDSQPIKTVASPEKKTSGRRTLLADWITSRENPLTARVMVNRLWQHHFGRGIVRSPNNFGLQGDRPTHPELLDWLASEFMAQGWKLKSMHRLIMTSQAYQRSSAGQEEALAKDPMNNEFWRFDMRRLTAEEIRDSILSVTGVLNPKMYGPGVYVDIPKEVLAGQSVPGSGWGQSPPEEQARRSVYIHVKRSLMTPILESFDVAETDRSAPVRFATVQPTQALGMLNGGFLNRQADVLASRLKRERPNDPAAQVRRAISLATSRVPAQAEIDRSLALMRSLQQEDGASSEVALRYFCLLVLNLNEMVYLD